MIVCIIDFIVIIFMGVSFNFYNSMAATNILYTVASTFLVIAFVIFMMMHMYIYPLMVTFKLTLKQLYQNALIFSFARLFFNLLILLICFVIAVGPYILMLVNNVNPIIYMLLTPFITYSLIGFLTNYYVYPTLKKHILDKLTTEEAKETENVFDDNLKI